MFMFYKKKEKDNKRVISNLEQSVENTKCKCGQSLTLHDQLSSSENKNAKIMHVSSKVVENFPTCIQAHSVCQM